MSYHICSLENTVFHMDDCKRSFKLFLLVTENPQPIFNISRIVAYLKHITICQLILEIETNKTILKFFVTKLPVTCGPKIYNKRQWITSGEWGHTLDNGPQLTVWQQNSRSKKCRIYMFCTCIHICRQTIQLPSSSKSVPFKKFEEGGGIKNLKTLIIYIWDLVLSFFRKRELMKSVLV